MDLDLVGFLFPLTIAVDTTKKKKFSQKNYPKPLPCIVACFNHGKIPGKNL